MPKVHRRYPKHRRYAFCLNNVIMLPGHPICRRISLCSKNCVKNCLLTRKCPRPCLETQKRQCGRAGTSIWRTHMRDRAIYWGKVHLKRDRFSASPPPPRSQFSITCCDDVTTHAAGAIVYCLKHHSDPHWTIIHNISLFIVRCRIRRKWSELST